VATLTYVYSDSTAVVGPLAAFAEPHSYDLCEEHAVRLTAPLGWEVVRHEGEFPAPIPYADDIEALAEAGARPPCDRAWGTCHCRRPAAGGTCASCPGVGAELAARWRVATHRAERQMRSDTQSRHGSVALRIRVGDSFIKQDGADRCGVR
jgi:hypothetical protein